MGAARGSAPPCPPKGLSSPLGIPAAIRKARFRRPVRGSLRARGFFLSSRRPVGRRKAALPRAHPGNRWATRPMVPSPSLPRPRDSSLGTRPRASQRHFILSASQPSSSAPRSILARPACAGSPSGAGLRVSAARHGRQGRMKPAKTFPLRLAPAGKARALAGFAGFTLSSLDPPRRPAAGQGKPSEAKRGREEKRLAALSSVRWRELIIHRERPAK